MPLEPLFQTVLCLADILFLASGACYAVHQVVPAAADIVSCSILLSHDQIFDVTIFVQSRAVSAARIGTLQRYLLMFHCLMGAWI